MSELIKPSLDLFLYDVRESWGEEDREIEKNHQSFLNKLPETVILSLIKQPIGEEVEYLELLPQRIKKVLPPKSDLYKQLGMYYYPVLLGDSYGLLLNCYYLNEDDCHVRCIKELKFAIQEKLNGQKGTMGQTWVISGCLPDAATGEAEEIARECYQYLMPNAKWDKNYQGQGRLLGGIMFELWGYDSPPSLSTGFLQDKHHVLIILYPNREIAKRATRLIFDWMTLFWYRSKILWVYGESRKLVKVMKQNFLRIKKCVQAVRREKFKKTDIQGKKRILQEAQDILSRYGIDLPNLEWQKLTIEINIKNYQKRLKKIRETAKKEQDLESLLSDKDYATDLKFITQFSTDIRDKYLLQVQKDYESLSPGLEVLEVVINSIRSMLEVEQAQNQRLFEKNVTIVGFALAVAVVIASISAQVSRVVVSRVVVSPDLMQQEGTIVNAVESWKAPAISLLITLLTAVMVGWAIKAWIEYKERSHD